MCIFYWHIYSPCTFMILYCFFYYHILSIRVDAIQPCLMFMNMYVWCSWNITSNNFDGTLYNGAVCIKLIVNKFNKHESGTRLTCNMQLANREVVLNCSFGSEIWDIRYLPHTRMQGDRRKYYFI